MKTYEYHHGFWKGMFIGPLLVILPALVIGFGTGIGYAHYKLNIDYLIKHNDTFITIFRDHWNEFKKPVEKKGKNAN
jgi:hypothetical protein